MPTSCCSGKDGTENCGSTAGAFDGRVEDNPGDMQQYCKALGGGSIPLTAYVMAVVLAGGGKVFPTVPIVFLSLSLGFPFVFHSRLPLCGKSPKCRSCLGCPSSMMFLEKRGVEKRGVLLPAAIRRRFWR